MKLAIISDEIALNFKNAVDLALEWGVDNFELRNLTTGRVPYISEKEQELIFKVKKRYNINISMISPGLFNISLQEEEQLKHELDKKIFDSFRFAEKVGTRDILISSFKRYDSEPTSDYYQIVHILGRMASTAERYGFRLLIENNKNCWCDTGDNTTKILDEINSKSLRANWDPANAFFAGEIPYPYGYLAVRKYVSNIHIKDVKTNDFNDFEIVPVGQGEIDWYGQFQAILQGVDLNYLTIETQCKPLINNSKLNVIEINNLLDEYILKDNYCVR